LYPKGDEIFMELAMACNGVFSEREKVEAVMGKYDTGLYYIHRLKVKEANEILRGTGSSPLSSPSSCLSSFPPSLLLSSLSSLPC
jgi:hypothetical protein